jgi:hypothetical protein
VGEDLLGVAQVVGEDVVIVPHTLSTDAVQCLFKITPFFNLKKARKESNVYSRLSDPYLFELPDPEPGPYIEHGSGSDAGTGANP